MVIVGLGNPGKQYEKTPHNVGFMVLDAIAKENQIVFRLEQKHQAMIGEGMIQGKKCYLIKPLTYMNLSGISVKSFMDYYHLDIHELMICFDDMDLPLGKIRIRKSGSSGGHKGMKSIIEQLHTTDIYRIRIGIDKPEEGCSVVDYVLHKLSKKELTLLQETIDLAPRMIEDCVQNGIDHMMNIYNGK